MTDSIKVTSLNAATVAGPMAGRLGELFSGRTRAIWTMQVRYTGNAPVQVDMEASFDGGTSWKAFASWKTADGRTSGDIMSVSEIALERVRANLITPPGGGGNVTAYIVGEDE